MSLSTPIPSNLLIKWEDYGQIKLKWDKALKKYISLEDWKSDR